MPGMFPINPAILPPVHTRKALMVIDLQNDLVSPDGALLVTEPEDFMARTLALVKDFRDSGLGDIIWVRSEFEEHRPLSAEADQIIVTDVPPRPSRVQSRGRQAASRPNPGAAHEADAEAFLSAPPGCNKPNCVRKSTSGSELAPKVQEAVVAGRDIVFTKTHYSAFASGQQQLVQLLRSRFVTEMYICGALTNVSIHATAVDAGRHGYDMTIVEDCCGFRSELRHIAAIRQIVHLTGSEVMTAENVKTQLKEFVEKKIPKPTGPPRMRSKKADGDGKGAGGSGVGKESPVRPLAAQSQSTGLSPVVSNISLSRGDDDSPVASPSSQPTASSSDPAQPQQSKEKPLQPVVAAKTSPGSGSQSIYVDPPLEAGSAVQTSDEGESLQDLQKLRGAARGAMQAAASQKDPESAPSPPQSARRLSASALTKAKTRRRTRAASSEENAPVQNLQSPPKKVDTSPAKKSSKIETRATETVSKKVKLEDSKPPEPEPIVDSNPEPPNMADQEQVATPTFSEPMCDGDTTIITNILPPNLADSAFDRLLSEVSWAGMSHLGGEVPRRIAVQGEVDEEGNMPVYRHPADESPPLLPFSPAVLEIKKEVEKHLGHPLNHVLIQHYRSGNDYISDHSDKSLDIMRGSFIANVSLGAERTMVFRTKRPPKDTAAKTPAAASSDDDGDTPKPALKTSDKSIEGPKRQIQRAPLPHNSLCRMGLGTNMRWLHAIRPDKRADREKSPAELAFAGARISLTFRRIGTFLDASQKHIWGQGATVKSLPDGPKDVSNGQTPEAVRMLQAFGAENHSSEFDWDAHYGTGFDVLHMGTPKRFCAGTRDAVGNMRVALALAEMGVGCAKGGVEGDVKFEDNDVTRTVVEGHETVLRYLDAVYGPGRRYDQLGAAEVAKRFVRLQKGLDLLGAWRTAIKQAESHSIEAATDGKERAKASNNGPAALMKKELAEWEGYAEEAAKTVATEPTDATKETPAGDPPFYIAGTPQPSPADFALWPVLHDIVQTAGEDSLKGALRRYYTAFRRRSAVEKVLGGGKEKTL